MHVVYLLIDFVKARFSNCFLRKFRVFPLKISNLKIAYCLLPSGSMVERGPKNDVVVGTSFGVPEALLRRKDPGNSELLKSDCFGSDFGTHRLDGLGQQLKLPLQGSCRSKFERSRFAQGSELYSCKAVRG